MKKAGKVIRTIFLVLFILIAVILIGARFYFRLPAKAYYRCSEKAFALPDIHSGFIPQGITYREEDGCYLLTGYWKGDGASPIYVLDKDGKLLSKALMQQADGSAFACHSGGISTYGDYVYIAGCQDCALYVFSYEEIRKGGNARLLGSFSTKLGDGDYLNVDFTTVHDGKILLGEFFREANYQTLESHKLTTGGGEYQQALALTFALGDYPETFGICPEPQEAYSIPDMVQGMAFRGERIYTSSSYGTAMSAIRTYDSTRLTEGKTVSVLGRELPLYELDSVSLVGTDTFPPMAEEIQFVDGKLVTMCESASNKYFFGKLTSHTFAYRTDMEALAKTR